ncbi:DUF2844 domain-containing protein [Paraburkholderia lacunae]|uniref:DUF2844 domain-containing protein n=1 Tax=Paraburkholderia lacunae TaxID=2211104 RepID=A0A370NE12_9BURK|nr:DUF2844 domain-containing protein [Paraburkholderia lacunae]RDK03837.1 hypothetical protein DLM46_06420 [Paraburkholderia lacunae]
MAINSIRGIAATAAIATSIGAMLAALPAHGALGSAPTYPSGTGADGSTTKTSAGTAASASFAARFAQASGVASAAYTVNETTTASGTVIREYVAQNNAVFAISWKGPTMAPLSTLLGDYFPSYTQGLADIHAAQGGGYGPAAVRQAGLVVETGGHMGAFHGRAYLPQALPQGLSADDIQ